MKFKNIPVSFFEECFNVFPDKGEVLWKRRPRNHFLRESYFLKFNSEMVGKPAGHANGYGYLVVYVNREGFFCHRIIWALHHRKSAFGEIDHINGDPKDNRICNLREVAHHCNMKNKSLYKTNSSGHHGVRWVEERGKWRAQIRNRDGKMTHIGYYRDLNDAVSERKKYEINFGYHRNHGGRDSHYQ